MMNWDFEIVKDLGEAVQESQKQGITDATLQKLKNHYADLEKFVELFKEPNKDSINELIQKLQVFDLYRQS